MFVLNHCFKLGWRFGWFGSSSSGFPSLRFNHSAPSVAPSALSLTRARLQVFFDDVDTTPVCAFPWAGPIWYDHATLTQMWDAMVDTYVKVGRILNAAG